MNELLSIDEMNARFDSQWVLVEDPEVDADLNIVRGKVVWHSKDRDEVYQKLLELRPKSAATLYVGSMPADTAVVL